MSDAGWTAVAALGAASLTALSSLGVVWVQGRLRIRAEAAETLRRAVVELLTRSISVATRSLAMGEAVKLRSGLGEGIDVALGVRKPVDALELYDWMHQDFAPMHLALAEIWSSGDQALVAAANGLAASCADLIRVGTAREPADNPLARMRRWARGDRWTPAMKAANDQAVKAVADARKALLNVARERLGEESVNVFT